ncbi:MAG: oligosaccharide flippase family protein, partial [Candidatus Caldarchaeum sp.]
LSMLLIGLYQTMSFWAIRRKQYSTLARTKLFQAIAGVSAQLGLGWLGAGSIGLIIGEIATRSMGFLSLLRSASIRAGEIQLESIKTLAIHYRRFGLFGLPDALLSVAVLNLPTLLIASLYEPTVVGWFGLVSRLVAAPVGIVGQALAQVYLGQAAAIYREGGSLHSIFTKTLRVLSLWSAIPFAIFGMVVLPYGITTLFDPQWKIAATLAVPMSLWYLGALIVSPLSQTLNILQKQHILLLWNLGRLLATLAVYGWAFLFVPSLTAMVWALALIHFTAYLTLLGILSMNVLQRGSP